MYVPMIMMVVIVVIAWILFHFETKKTTGVRALSSSPSLPSEKDVAVVVVAAVTVANIHNGFIVNTVS